MKSTGRILRLASCLFASGMGSAQPVAAGALILAVSTIAVSAKDPKIEKGAVVTLAGTLKKGMVAIGGESTGWVLEYQSTAGMETIQVDPMRLDLEEIPEGYVTVKGDIAERDYPQSGPTLVLRAEKIKPKRGKGA